MALFGIPSRRSGSAAQSAPGAGHGAAQAGGMAKAPIHHVPPTPRELRAQVVHRLQIGLFGLVAMLLLVGLANVILDRAYMADAAAVADPDASASASTTPANDPLVDMGVTPELPGANRPADKPSPAAAPKP